MALLMEMEIRGGVVIFPAIFLNILSELAAGGANDNDNENDNDNDNACLRSRSAFHG